MKPAITLFVIIAVIALMWSAAAVRVTQPVTDTESTVDLTADKINKLTEGMTVQDAYKIAGKPSTTQKLSGKAEPDTDALLCKWVCRDGIVVTARFVNNRLSEVGSTAPEN